MFRERDGDTLFELTVKPGSGRVSLKVKKGIVHLSVTNPPVKNQANREIIRLLSEFFDVPVEIEKSMPGYRKLIRVKGLSMSDLKKKLGMADE
ncbi:MAG: DUF167 family protein [Candidatus Wallbacteria bacterium]|nr:DUF167 family protein [Candidatus Wallbacteria bacterium]